MGEPQRTSWSITSAVVGLYLLLAQDRPQVADAGQYWTMSTRFASDYDFYGTHAFRNQIDVLAFFDQLRGYTFPLMIRLVTIVGQSASPVARLMSLAMVPLLLCVLVPRIARAVSPAARITTARILILSAMFLAFWRDDLLYLLSDLPALTIFAAAAVLLLERPGPLSTVAAGFLFGLAVNIRPAYLLGAFVAVALLGLIDRGWKRIVLRVVLVAFGASVVTLPQVVINMRNFDSPSPMAVDATNLSNFQLMSGLRIQRYETYRGAGGRPSLQYRNEALAPFVNFGTIGGLGDYAGFFVDHPVPTTRAILGHVFNGLDLRRPGTYVASLDDATAPLQLANFMLLFTALFVVAHQRWYTLGVRLRSPTTWFLAVLGASCLTSILGAVETRYLLPLHLTLLAIVAFNAHRGQVPTSARWRVLALLGLALAIGVSFTISRGVDSSLVRG